jgi:hypothetical protein
VLTDIHDLRILHDEFMHGQGGDVEEDAGADHGQDTRDPSEHAEEAIISDIVSEIKSNVDLR